MFLLFHSSCSIRCSVEVGTPSFACELSVTLTFKESISTFQKSAILHSSSILYMFTWKEATCACALSIHLSSNYVIFGFSLLLHTYWTGTMTLCIISELDIWNDCVCFDSIYFYFEWLLNLTCADNRNPFIRRNGNGNYYILELYSIYTLHKLT